MKDSIQNKENSKHTLTVMILTLLSRLLGIVKARVITTAFGASSTADVINVAYFLPNNLRKIFAEGAINNAFVPSLAKSEDKGYRNKLISLMLSFQLIIFSVLILVFILFSRQIFNFISDFEANELDLGSKLLPYFIAFLAFISFANIFTSVLQTDKKYKIFGIAPLFFSVTLIIIVSLTNKELGAMSMAYGVLAASIMQFLFSLIFVLKNGYKVSFSFNYKDKEFKRILRLWLIVLSSSITTILAQQFSTYLASSLESGSATAFSNSMIFFSTPYGIINAGFISVVFPLLAKYYHEKDTLSFNNSLMYGIDGMINLFIPATIILMFLNKEFVAVLLQNGKFTYADTKLTASITYYLVIGLTVIGINSILNKTLIIIGKEKLSFYLIVLQSILDVIISLLLIRRLGIIALPIANTVSFSITLILHIIILNKIIDIIKIIKTFFKTLIANIPLIFILVLYKLNFNSWYISGSNFNNLIILCLLCCVLGLLILFSYKIFKIPFIQYFKIKK